MTVLLGLTVTLRPATPADALALATIRATPEVQERWGGADDVTAEILDDLVAPELHLLVIEAADRIVGAIQWQASEDPVYRHAGIDLYVDPALHGRGLGTDAVRTLARHLIHDHRHHRLVVDPAADNLRSAAWAPIRQRGCCDVTERQAEGSRERACGGARRD